MKGVQKKRWKSTPWKMGSSLFDGVDWERWKKNKIPLELSKVPTALELFSLRSRRNKKDQDGPRRTLILMKAQDGPRRTLILKKAQNRPRGTLILKKAQDGPRRTLILKIVGRCPWLKEVGKLFSTYSKWKIIPKFPGVATTEQKMKSCFWEKCHCGRWSSVVLLPLIVLFSQVPPPRW